MPAVVEHKMEATVYEQEIVPAISDHEIKSQEIVPAISDQEIKSQEIVLLSVITR